jgi:nitrate/nitrite transporter NarK
MYTLASDMFPRVAVGSVVGFASMAGAIGALFAANAVGYIPQFTGSYVLVFLIAGSAYRFAFLGCDFWLLELHQSASRARKHEQSRAIIGLPRWPEFHHPRPEFRR